jgi:hypothetical protein
VEVQASPENHYSVFDAGRQSLHFADIPAESTPNGWPKDRPLLYPFFHPLVAYDDANVYASI